MKNIKGSIVLGASLLFLTFVIPVDAQPLYYLDLGVDPGTKKVSVREKVAFTNIYSTPVTELYFHVYPHRAYTPAEKKLLLRYASYFKVNVFPDGFPKDLFKLNSLRIKDQDVSCEWEGDDQSLLKIILPQPLGPGHTVEVQMDFDLKIPHAYSRFGWNESVIKLSQWYPILAVYDGKDWKKYPFYPFHRPFFTNAAYYYVTLTLPQDQVVIHTGTVVEEKPSSDGKKTLQITTPLPVRDFTLALSADYEVVEENLGSVRIKSFYLSRDGVAGQAALASAKSLMEYYTELFGPYPYPEFSIAPVPLGYGGEQMSNLVFIDTRAYQLPGFLHRYFDFLVSHETGHQWFYNVVGVDEYTQIWLEEGVNSYFIQQYLKEKYGPDAEIIDYPKWAEAGEWLFPKFTFNQTRDYLYKRMVRVGYEAKPVIGALSRFREPSSIFYLAYGKGTRVLEMLEKKIGAEALGRVFRRAWKEYQFANMGLDDFRRICAEESGQDLTGFFDQWLLETKYLDYRIAGVKDKKLQVERRGGIEMPADVKVRFRDGTEQTLTWDGKNERESLPLTSSSPVVQAVIDPSHDLLDIDRTNNFWPRKLTFKPVPFYWGFYDMPLFQDEESYNVFVGPETASSGVGLKAAWHKPYDQIFYGGIDYEMAESLQHSRVGYMLKNVLRTQTVLGFELNDTKDWEDGREDVASGKIFLRRELRPATYSLSEINDHVTLYMIRNQRLSDRAEIWDYRESDHQLEYSRREESIVGASFKLSDNGPFPDPVQGYQVQGMAESAGHFFGATQYFYRSAVDTIFYQPVTAHSRLAFRTKYGWGFPEDKDLYQLGGMNDLRGYDYKSFRGASMLLGSGEYRFPLRENLKWSFLDHIVGVEAVEGVVFFDAASAWFDNVDDAKWKRDVGVGLRFIVNFGAMLEKVVIRLDAAYPLNGTEKDTHFWLGLNHAF